MRFKLQVKSLISGLLVLLSISPLQSKIFTWKETKSYSTTEFSAISHKMSQRLYNLNPKNSSSRQKRSISLDDIRCNQSSLEAILENCKNFAAVSLTSSSSGRERNADSSSFCGPSCSNLVFRYVNVCNLQEFLLNVSGACKLDGSTFTVRCIHAVVVIKPGAGYCSRTLQDSELHSVRSLLDPSKHYTESQCCSLQIYHNSSLPGHEIIYDHTVQKLRVEPPLEPPWLNMSEYGPVLDITKSDLCIQEATTAAATSELLHRTNKLVTPVITKTSNSGTCSSTFRVGFVFYSFVLLFAL